MSAPILVWVDGGERPSRAALQAIGAARAAAAHADREVVGVAPSEAAEGASRFLGRVLAVDLPDATQDARARAIGAAADASAAAVVVMAATRTAQAVAPRLAVRRGASLLEDVTALSLEGDAIHARRLTQLQRVSESIVARRDSAIVTTKVGAFEPAEASDDTGSVEPLAVDFEPSDGRVTVEASAGGGGAKTSLEEAPVVVAGGRGIGSPEAFEQLVEPLARRLGGVVGATRAAVDAGWRPYDEQIGQTGKTVAPELYVALGLSGAVQHLSGMNRSRTIVAINEDGDAPIFRHCDVGIVGDVHELVPALLDALGEGGD